jgi:integrase
VILPPHIVQDIRDHLANFVDAAPDSPLFPAKTSCRYSDRLFSEAFNKACKDVGIQQIPRVHDLRHFAGSQAARVGNLVMITSEDDVLEVLCSQHYSLRMLFTQSTTSLTQDFVGRR